MTLTYRWGYYNLIEALDMQSDTHVGDIIKEKGRKPSFIVLSNVLDIDGEDSKKFPSEELAKAWIEERYTLHLVDKQRAERDKHTAQ